MQTALVMTLWSNVTAPLRASARPSIAALVFTVMDSRARMLPLKKELVSMVAELPTCQNTLQACAPLMSETLLVVAVIRVDPILKMKTAFGSPLASRVTVPVRFSDDEAL